MATKKAARNKADPARRDRIDPERVKEARKALAITQWDLAAKMREASKGELRVDGATISKLETGEPRDWGVMLLCALSDVTGRSMDWLCARTK